MSSAGLDIDDEAAVRFVFGVVLALAGDVWLVPSVGVPFDFVCGVGR